MLAHVCTCISNCDQISEYLPIYVSLTGKRVLLFCMTIRPNYARYRSRGVTLHNLKLGSLINVPCILAIYSAQATSVLINSRL